MTLTEGQIVQWDLHMNEELRNYFIQKHGRGPFTIKDVEYQGNIVGLHFVFFEDDNGEIVRMSCGWFRPIDDPC